jgi:hypothetical protein
LTAAVTVAGEALHDIQVVVVIPRTIGVAHAVFVEKVLVIVESQDAVILG